MNTIAKCLVGVALLVPALVNAAGGTVDYSNGSSFLTAVGQSYTDDFSGYGATQASPVVLTDAQMSAVHDETRFQALTHPNINIVGFDFVFATSDEYCAGCNGGFEMYYDKTSVSSRAGVYGVAFNIDLQRSPVSEIPDPTAPPGTPGTLIVNFAHGPSQDFVIPADVGFNGPAPYFFGITNPREIASIILSDDGGDNRDWIISDLTIAAAPRSVPEPATLSLLALGLAGVGFMRRRKKH